MLVSLNFMINKYFYPHFYLDYEDKVISVGPKKEVGYLLPFGYDCKFVDFSKKAIWSVRLFGKEIDKDEFNIRTSECAKDAVYSIVYLPFGKKNRNCLIFSLMVLYHKEKMFFLNLLDRFKCSFNL